MAMQLRIRDITIHHTPRRRMQILRRHHITSRLLDHPSPIAPTHDGTVSLDVDRLADRSRVRRLDIPPLSLVRRAPTRPTPTSGR